MYKNVVCFSILTIALVACGGSGSGNAPATPASNAAPAAAQPTTVSTPSAATVPATTASAAPAATVPTATASTPAAATDPAPTIGVTPLNSSGPYVDPTSDPAIWVVANSSDTRAADIRSRLASQPIAKWFGGWSGDIGAAVDTYMKAAAAAGRTPSLVAYNIPGRDCGQYSAGGANSLSGYQSWIHDFAAAIGARSAIVILEPDALPQITCLSAEGQAGRLQIINYAVAQFKTLAPNTWVYLDIGHSAWLSVSDAATRLAAAGIANARGFSLNVSNYRTDAESKAYGIAVSAALQQQTGTASHFVVDTSRNGNGPLGSEWCDPAGRKIGVAPTRYTDGSQPEMNLWIKVPGDADGCAATAGTFVPDLAVKLISGN